MANQVFDILKEQVLKFPQQISEISCGGGPFKFPQVSESGEEDGGDSGVGERSLEESEEEEVSLSNSKYFGFSLRIFNKFIVKKSLFPC